MKKKYEPAFNSYIDITVPSGTGADPRYYWVVVQDAAENGVISGTNLHARWKREAVTSKILLDESKRNE